ncbi:MAG: macrolide ABC transporter ATP-binding protein/permease, partial [Oscillospiraceae bacterium]
GASGTGGKDDEQGGSVKQEIDGYYDKYLYDDRVEHALLITPFNDIAITVDGKSYNIEKSNSYPYMNKIIDGRTPNGTGNEVIVPEKFVETLGIANKEAIGKEIEFSCAIYSWDSGEPVLINAKTKATIVGVVDTTIVTDSNGEKFTYNVDDTFIFSKSALSELRSQANLSNDKTNFTIRAKSPADMVLLKDEFNKAGIVPIGRFELVEDLVRLNTQTTEQSGLASIV